MDSYIFTDYVIHEMSSIYYVTSIVPALRAGIIHNEKQWELYHLYQ